MSKDVHTEHCCAVHGCKYSLCCRVRDPETHELRIVASGDTCPVVSGVKKQSFPCDTCDWELDEYWPEILMMNEMYDRGYARGRRDAEMIKLL